MSTLVAEIPIRKPSQPLAGGWRGLAYMWALPNQWPGLVFDGSSEPIDDILLLEARIEALAETCERCRKIILVSKAAIGGGIACLLVLMLGLFGPSQAAAIGLIAMVLGGIVSLGSNVSTLRQTTAAMHAAEQLRASLIDRLDLRVVETD